MGKRAVVYDLHVLATDTEPEERYEFTDAAAAVIGYNRLACERRRRAVLTKTGHLPDMEPEIVGSYIPDDDAPPISLPAGRLPLDPWAPNSPRSIMVRLGDPQPAFPREQTAREDADETLVQQGLRRQTDQMRAAAYWYAKGFIDCVGGLSPFGDEDATAFADWHVETAFGRNLIRPITEQWATWSAQRREEIGA
jgi:hypothetical protein